MKYVLFVAFAESAEDILAKAPLDFHAHRARMQDFHRRGALLMSGPFHDPGAALATMGIFTTREAAEEFAAGDPFVRNGMARSWSIRAWNDVLAEPAGEGIAP